MNLQFDKSGKIKQSCTKELYAKGLKYCSKCKSVKHLSEFQYVKEKPTTYCHQCRKDDGKKYMRKKYQTELKGKIYNKQKKEHYVQRFGGKCQRCGYNEFIECLHFHHIDLNKIPEIISRAFDNRYKIDIKDLEEELEKCILLCYNCHMSYHYNLWK